MTLWNGENVIKHPLNVQERAAALPLGRDMLFRGQSQRERKD